MDNKTIQKISSSERIDNTGQTYIKSITSQIMMNM